MKPKQEMTAGATFNKLTSIKYVRSNKWGKQIWLFQCECGRRTEQIFSGVRCGHTKSCGCLKTFRMNKINKRRRVFPIIGKVYGRLTAIKYAHESTKDYRRLWWFQCACGKQVKTAASLVIYGNKKSCGCLAISMQKGRAPFASEDDIALRMPKRVWTKTYSDGCPFDLFLSISQKPCHYCGKCLSNTATRTYTDGVATFYYNGLDRIDATKDHSPDNIIPCCRRCNIAKNDMTYDEFLAWNARVYQHTNREKNDTCSVLPSPENLMSS